MTRKQALCGIISRYPEIPFNTLVLKQMTTIKSQRHLVEHRYTLSCGFAMGYGTTIQEAFDSLMEVLK